VKCDMTTELTDAEVGAIVRAAAGLDGVARRFEAIAVTAECRLEERHESDCASWQADLTEEDGTAWFRWGNERRIDWLAECVTEGCPLYRGHPGGCTVDGGTRSFA
jgi:hypothetical protein